MWSKELIELLITKYKEHDNLYNVRDPDYLDRTKRTKSLTAICQELKPLYKDITVEAIKKKIHTLRAQYIKESRLITNSKKSGAGADEVYVPRLWYYPQLQFLKPHCVLRKPDSNISEFDESESDNSFLVENEALLHSEAEAPTLFKRKKKSFHLEDRIGRINEMLTARSEQINCYDWLGEQVVFQISKLRNERLQQDAAWDIQQILRRALLKDSQNELEPNYSEASPPTVSSLIPISQEFPIETGLDYCKNCGTKK